MRFWRNQKEHQGIPLSGGRGDQGREAPLFPRLQFEQAVRDHKAEYQARGFTSWGQFVAMLFCQLGRAHTLREICGGLASCEGKLKHLGVPDAPKKSTLAYANEHRPWSLYQTIFEQLRAKCHAVVAGRDQKRKFRFKNKLVRLDSSVIDLSLSVFDWAKFRRTKGAVKIKSGTASTAFIVNLQLSRSVSSRSLRCLRQGEWFHQAVTHGRALGACRWTRARALLEHRGPSGSECKRLLVRSV